MVSLLMTNKTGTFFINDQMDLRSVECPSIEYNQLLISSILRAAKWLDDMVLRKNHHDGHFLRQKLKEGIFFTDEMNKYFISSYAHWEKTLSQRSQKEQQNTRESEIPQRYEPIPSVQNGDSELSKRIKILREILTISDPSHPNESNF